MSKSPPPPDNRHGKPLASYLDFVNRERFTHKLKLVESHIGKVGTPFMILQLSESEQALNYFAKHIPFVSLYYAVKANPHPAIMSLVKRRGLRVDVASMGEVYMALQAGFDGSQMILANPNKNDESLHCMFQQEISMFTYDNERELLKIAAFRDKHGYKHNPKSLLRFKPLVQKYSRKNDTPTVGVDLSKKFGAPLEKASRLLSVALQMNLNPSGLAYHIGSNCHRVQNYITNFRLAVELLEKCNAELKLNMSVLDIGGGFPVNTNEAKGIDGLDSFYARLATRMREFDLTKYEVIAEPGRAIAGPAGVTVMTIIGRRHDGHKNWLILDDGLFGTLSPIVHDNAKYIYLPVNRKFHMEENHRKLETFTLGGPTCDSHDVLAEGVLLPRDIDVGDQVMILDTGAYSLTTATTFNGFEAANVLVDEQYAQFPQAEEDAA
jgi:ornithine decarboxylase